MDYRIFSCIIICADSFPASGLPITSVKKPSTITSTLSDPPRAITLPRSAVPEAEQCGLCTDKFGVTWQVAPRILDEMMRDPKKADAVAVAFMPMKKLDLETIRKAGQ